MTWAWAIELNKSWLSLTFLEVALFFDYTLLWETMKTIQIHHILVAITTAVSVYVFLTASGLLTVQSPVSHVIIVASLFICNGILMHICISIRRWDRNTNHNESFNRKTISFRIQAIHICCCAISSFHLLMTLQQFDWLCLNRQSLASRYSHYNITAF